MMHSTTGCTTCTACTESTTMVCKPFTTFPQCTATHHKGLQHTTMVRKRSAMFPQCTTVGLSVCRSTFVMLEKRLSGSGCRWGRWLGGPGIGVLNFGGDRRREGAILGVSLKRCMVVNEKFIGWLCGSGCGIETKRLSGSTCRWR